MQRSVGVLNIDSCVTGPISAISSSPVLQDIMMDALKHASDPTTVSKRSSNLTKFNGLTEVQSQI